jgi:hypothetical protein
MRRVDGFVTTQLLYVAAKLGIAPLLKAEPKTTDELAATVAVDAALLHRVLRGLALEDVVAERDDGRFELTRLGEQLIALEATVIVRGEVYYPAAGRLFEAVTNGGVPFERYHGHRFFEYFAHNPDQEVLFQTSMAGRSQQEAADVVAAHDFGQYGTLVDVGGGRGVLLAAILKSAPALHGVLFDLDASIPAALAYLRDVGVDDRVECVGGDFFDEAPPGADVYVMSRVLHDWDDDDATRILTTCRNAMRPDSRLLVVDAVLPERATDRPDAVHMDILMLMFLGARERTALEFGRLLAHCGFRLDRVVLTRSPAGLGVLEATLA